MCEFAGEDVREDFCVAVWVGWEAGLGCDSVFIEDAEGSERLESRIEVIGEGECVKCAKPAMICVPSLATATRDDLGLG